MKQFCKFCYFLQDNYGNIELNRKIFSSKLMYYKILTLSKIILNRSVRKKRHYKYGLYYINLGWECQSYN